MSDNNLDNFDDLMESYNSSMQSEGVQPHNKNSDGSYTLFILSIIFSVIGFMLFCLNLLFKNKLQSQSISHNLGYAFGSIMLIAIIFLIFSKKKVPLLIFAIVFLFGSLSSMTVTMAKISNNSVKFKAAQQKLVMMCNEVATKKTITDEKYDRAKYGDLAEFLTYANGYFKKILKISEDLNHDIAAVGFGNILKPETLSSTEKMNNAKKSLADSKKMFDKYETSFNELSSGIISDVEKMDMAPALKEGYITSFTKAQVESNRPMSKFFNVEREISDKVNEILDFMIFRQKSYVVKDGKILFYNETDVDKYNAYMKELDQLAKKESSIKAEAQNTTKVNLEKLNQYK